MENMRLKEIEKFKHELLGSLGIIKMLSGSLMTDIQDHQTNQALSKLINESAIRNIEIISSFDWHKLGYETKAQSSDLTE